MRQGRAVRLIGIGIAGLALSAGTAVAAMGDLDPGFSGDGKLVYDVADSGRADAIVIDSQGRVLVAGNVDPPNPSDNGDFAVARFLPNGVPDASFSGDGFVAISVGALNSANDGEAVAVDPAGNVYVGGGSGGANGDFTVVRLTGAGAIDGSYGGGDGIATLDTGDNGDGVDDMQLDSAGRVVIGGVSNADFAVARFTAAGIPDTTFGGGDGWQRQNVNSAASTDSVNGMKLDSAGRPVVSGWTRLAVGEENFAVMRFTADGLLDTTFSNDIPTPGRTIQLMSSEAGADMQDVGLSLAIAAGDRPVVSGFAEITGSTEDVALLKLDAAGEPDPSFSGDGKAYLDLGGSDRAEAITIDGAGRIAFTGRLLPTVGSGLLVAGRFGANGAPDPSFSGDGFATADIGPLDDFGTAIAIDGAGRLVTAGYAGPFATAEWELARFEGVPRCGGKIPTLTGTPGNDKLKGTKGKDVISGGDGKDKILGLAKADTLCGENGKDKLFGGKGNDKLLGGKGRDTLIGGKGKDKLKGGKGKDKQRQ